MFENRDLPVKTISTIDDMENEIKRLKTLLYNAIVLLEDENNLNLIPKSNRLLSELGMSEEEYDEIMGTTDEEDEDEILKRVRYLREKEKVCPLDDEERYFLYEYGG